MSLTARDIFWRSYSERLYENYYLDDYKQKLLKEEKILDCFLALVSSASIAAWTFWGKFPALWALLTAAAQAVSLVKPYFKHAENITCISFCLQEYEIIVDEMELEWRRISRFSDDDAYKLSDDIYSSCAEFERKLTELKSKYITPLDMPLKKSCYKGAMKKRDDHLLLYDNEESEVRT